MTDQDRGTIGLDDGAVQIRFRRRLSRPVDQVRASLVDPDEQSRWMPRCTFEARVGAPVSFDFEGLYRLYAQQSTS